MTLKTLSWRRLSLVKRGADSNLEQATLPNDRREKKQGIASLASRFKPSSRKPSHNQGIQKFHEREQEGVAQQTPNLSKMLFDHNIKDVSSTCVRDQEDLKTTKARTKEISLHKAEEGDLQERSHETIASQTSASKFETQSIQANTSQPFVVSSDTLTFPNNIANLLNEFHLKGPNQLTRLQNQVLSLEQEPTDTKLHNITLYKTLVDLSEKVEHVGEIIKRTSLEAQSKVKAWHQRYCEQALISRTLEARIDDLKENIQKEFHEKLDELTTQIAHERESRNAYERLCESLKTSRKTLEKHIRSQSECTAKEIEKYKKDAWHNKLLLAQNTKEYNENLHELHGQLYNTILEHNTVLNLYQNAMATLRSEFLRLKGASTEVKKNEKTGLTAENLIDLHKETPQTSEVQLHSKASPRGTDSEATPEMDTARTKMKNPMQALHNFFSSQRLQYKLRENNLRRSHRREIENIEQQYGRHVQAKNEAHEKYRLNSTKFTSEIAQLENKVCELEYELRTAHQLLNQSQTKLFSSKKKKLVYESVIENLFSINAAVKRD